MTMRFFRSLVLVITAFAVGVPAMAQQLASKRTNAYNVTQDIIDGHTAWRLRDTARKMELVIVPDVGLFTYKFTVNGKDVFIAPESLKAYIEKRLFRWGNPFLAPFANRIDKDYYFFEGKKYLLNDSLGNLERVSGSNYPIHGLLIFEPRWEVAKSGASLAEGAFLTSRLEFYKYPDLMANFPFAHTYEVTYRLKDGKLECTTKVVNVGKSRMPVQFGYHPYFRPDGPREEWTLSIGARKHWPTERALIPTGATEPTEKLLPGVTKGMALGPTFIDDTFSDFARDSKGLGSIWVKGKTQKIEVVYDKEIDYAVVYAPLDNTLICLEPEIGPTNAFNLAHEGKFKGLIVLEPGKTFTATFWIVPTGF